MQDQDEQKTNSRTFIDRLFPDLSEEERGQAEKAWEGYVTLVRRVLTRLKQKSSDIDS